MNNCMFVDFDKTKIRAGLTELKKYFVDYGDTLPYTLKITLAVVDDEVVGCIAYGGGRIHHVRVKEDARHMGYGRKLLKYAMTQMGDGIVVAHVERSDTKTLQAFIGWGFFFDGYYCREECPDHKLYRLKCCGEVAGPTLPALMMSADLDKFIEETVLIFTSDVTI